MAAPGARSTWHHQPVFWLGALILAATLAGCIQLIALATRHADEPLATAQPILFGMPTAQPAAFEHPHDPPGEAPR
jgi:hypothetical protein